jgi:hypothetical protein
MMTSCMNTLLTMLIILYSLRDSKELFDLFCEGDDNITALQSDE